MQEMRSGLALSYPSVPPSGPKMPGKPTGGTPGPAPGRGRSSLRHLRPQAWLPFFEAWWKAYGTTRATPLHLLTCDPPIAASTPQILGRALVALCTDRDGRYPCRILWVRTNRVRAYQLCPQAFKRFVEKYRKRGQVS